MPELKELNEKIDALNSRATELLEKAEAADNTEEVQEFKSVVENEIKPQLETLNTERQERLKELEIKALTGEVTTLKEALDELRKPAGDFTFGSEGKAGDADENDPYQPGQRSFYADILRANKGDTEAKQRLAEGAGVEGKAMTEGTAAQGGYLVQKRIEKEIIEAKELDNVLRGLVSKINVGTNEIELSQISLATTAGWVAELATKPESTSLTQTTVSASVFTAAGLATISNQLLADSNPAVDNLVTSDLAKRLVALEEAAFLNGTGTGQPLGILNTPGVQSTAITSTSVSAAGGLLEKVLDAIAAVQDSHGQPSAILLHPRTWTRILKDKDANGVWTFQPGGQTPYANDPSKPRTNFAGPTKTLFGVPVVLSNRIPTNLGAGTNESRVIVADFSEALILDRQGITVDESPHVYFTSNQTVFRAEERVGFTAARQPLAFNVIGGAGLASG